MAAVKKQKRTVTKTVLIYDQCGEAPITFYLVDGDYRHLHGVYVNSTACTEAEIDELNSLTADPASMKSFKKFPRKAVLKGAAVITCGFYP